jgi:hypothetical protein
MDRLGGARSGSWKQAEEMAPNGPLFDGPDFFKQIELLASMCPSKQHSKYIIQFSTTM